MNPTLIIMICMNNNNDMRTEDGFSVKWKVSMNTELDMKTRKNSGNDSDIKRNSSMVMLELHALSVIVCALIVAAAPGGDGWSGRGGARRNRCGKREKLRHHDVYACAGWRIVVGCWSCCALTSRPRVCLPGGKRLGVSAWGQAASATPPLRKSRSLFVFSPWDLTLFT